MPTITQAFTPLYLSPGDMCDACTAAKASVLVANSDDFVLAFCHHHATKHLSALTTEGWAIVDDVR